MTAEGAGSPARLRPRALPLAAATLAVGLGLVLLVDHVRWRRHRDALLDLIAEAGLEERHEGLAHEVRTEADAGHADLAVARALVHDVLALGLVAGPERATELRRRGAFLGRAEELAAGALRSQPGSWQASMLVGAARYLGWSLARDRRLVTEAAAWEKPLEAAVRAAPGQAEPRRFLAAAYLEVWRHLSPAKRETAKELLETAFRDPETFRLLVGTWIAVAPDVESAFAVVPPRPDAWQALASSYAETHRFELFRRAWVRYQDTLEETLRERLVEADRRIDLGDLYYGRSFLLRVVVDAPLERRFAPFVEEALGRYPPGLHGLTSTDALARWLAWALELALLERSPLAPRILGRLAGTAGELEPSQAALAALLGGEIDHAESFERQVEDLGREAWTPYLLAKARWHLDRDETATAAELLGGADRNAQGELLYWLLQERLARAKGDLVGREEAEAKLAEGRRQVWTGRDWRSRSGRLTLTLLPERPARGLVLELAEVPAPGAVVQALWDGESIGTFTATGPGRHRLSVAVDPALHLFELRTLAGRQPALATVRLE